MHPSQGSVVSIIVKILKNFDYVSVNSKPDYPPGDPRGFGTSPLPGGSGFHPTFLARGLGFRIREIFYIVRKGKCRNFSICFKDIGGRIKSMGFLCCFISISEKKKQWMSTVSLIK